jgi:plasmid stabilization system protein ParE
LLGSMLNKKLTLKWTPFALSCLDQIYDYIAFREKSDASAFKFVNKIFERVDQLIDFPESGQAEPLLAEIGRDSRYLVIASYKIIYEYLPVQDTVIITDIFHTSQYPEKVKRSSK